MAKIKNVINFLSNKVYTKIVRSRLKNQNFTIFCNVCIGGVIYSHLGMKFLLPTINLQISTEDFLKFLLNYNSYINAKLDFVGFDIGPVAKLDDIVIHFNHYKTNQEAFDAWERRKKRININNAYVIIHYSENDVISQKDLDNLSSTYRNVILLSNEKLHNIKYKYIKTPKNKKDYQRNWYGLRYWEAKFNFVKFLNKNIGI